MAARFWVGGTGTWDNSATTHWSGSTGGANGASVPGVNDAVTLDGASGGGTVTVNTTVTVQSITCGAFTGTLDFSANNNSVTLSAATGFNGSGSGTRTINLGNGTWTLTATGTIWNMATTTNLTFSANSSVLTFTATSASSRTFASGALTYATVTVSANTSGGSFLITGATGPTIATLNVTAPNYIAFVSGQTTTISNAFTWTGSSTAQNQIASSTRDTTATVAAAASSTMSWAGVRDMTFTGSPTATSSFDLGHNSGITITAPSTAAGLSRARSFAGMH